MRKQFKQKAIGLLALACVASSVFAVATYSVSAEDTCALTMRDGAAVRVGNTVAGTGIRFSANIDESIYTVTDTENHVAEFKDDVTEVGMIIVPAAALKNVGEADVFSYLQNTYSATKAEISTQFSSDQIQWDEKGYYVAGAIVSIQDSNLGLEYQAIPYTYDGKDYTYGTASKKRTISYVFNQALTDTDAEALAKKPDVLAKAIEMNAKLDITTELSVADGGDLSAFTAEGYVIDSVTLGGTPVTVADNVIEENTLDKTAAKKDAQTLAITYAGEEDEQKTLNVNAQVWSLYINNAEELTTKMDDYAYSVGEGTNVAVYGYYKLENDITENVANYPVNGNNQVASNTKAGVFNTNYGFQGVFDGCGYTVDGLKVTHRSMFGVIGKNAVFKNVNFTNVTFAPAAASSNNSAIFAGFANGGTVENVSVEYTIPSNLNTVGTAPYMSGVLFGQVYTNGIALKINLKDVSITALNAAEATNENFAVLGALRSDYGYYTSDAEHWGDTKFNATNVSIVGAGIYGDLKDNTVCRTGWEGLTFKTGKPTVLTAVDTEIGATVTFADYVNGTIASVSYNGEAAGESLTVTDKTQASDVARNYVITTTDGEKYILPITVWSLLIDNGYELVNGMKEAAWSNANAYYGYYKVNSDIKMTTENIVNGNGMVANVNACSDKTQGFQGVFDGGGHTIENLVVKHRSLFGAIGQDAVFRNVTFANVSYDTPATGNNSSNTALLGSWVNGGTLENVTVTYTIPNNYYSLEQPAENRPCYCGVLFGFVYAGNSGNYSKITLTNVNVTALNASTATNANFAVFGVLKSTYGTVSSWGGVYFNATDVTVTGGAIYGDLKDQTMIKQTGNGFAYNAA